MRIKNKRYICHKIWNYISEYNKEQILLKLFTTNQALLYKLSYKTQPYKAPFI